jgi:hypothetical protein
MKADIFSSSVLNNLARLTFIFPPRVFCELLPWVRDFVSAAYVLVETSPISSNMLFISNICTEQKIGRFWPRRAAVPQNPHLQAAKASYPPAPDALPGS